MFIFFAHLMNISCFMMFVLYALLLPIFISVNGDDKPKSELELIANFDHQVTGVSVHPASGRIFVNFPRWTEDSPVSVAEVVTNNTIEPFPPKSDWNSWRNTRKNELDPGKYFICVQSVVVFKDSLYVLDPAAPAFGPLVNGGPKLVEIDLINNKIKRTILFDEQVAPQGSYLNDVRFSPDGKYAYITDSGATGAIVVVDLTNEKAKRVLHGHPSTQVDKKV
jgi:DNA-binding beta-propeller fold protein YncE